MKIPGELETFEMLVTNSEKATALISKLFKDKKISSSEYNFLNDFVQDFDSTLEYILEKRMNNRF